MDTTEPTVETTEPTVPAKRVAKPPYVRLSPEVAKARRIEAAHKRWRTIKARRAAMVATEGPVGPKNAS